MTGADLPKGVDGFRIGGRHEMAARLDAGRQLDEVSWSTICRIARGETATPRTAQLRVTPADDANAT